MPLDPAKPDLLIGVVGTGAMGRGIMQIAAQGGLNVVAIDEQPGAGEAAKAAISATLGRLAAQGKVSEEVARASIDRIAIAESHAALASADVIVEAIVERLDVKQALFERLDGLTRPDTILASNTSSLPITAIAARCKAPERVAGFHFFNPVPLMRLVEVIPGLRTAPWVTDALMAIARRMTREPVLAADSPGFIVNHIGRAYVPEAARILSEGIAGAHAIDRIMTGAPGFRMGPFTLLDLVGADVSVAVMESLWGQFYGEPMYATQPILRQRVDAGLYGQKSGAGWYAYRDGKRIEQDAPPSPPLSSRPLWVRPSPHHPDLQMPLVELLAKNGTRLETGTSPSMDAAIILTPIGYDLTTAITELKLDAARTVAVDVMQGLKGPRTLMVTPATDPGVRDAVHAALTADGEAAVVINDSPGFVAQRIVAHVVNVAAQIAQRGIATPEDIDKGAKLGLGYPFGPLEWGDRLGPARVLFILERLYAFYGEPRYRPSPWLRRRAALGLSLLTPDREAVER